MRFLLIGLIVLVSTYLSSWPLSWLTAYMNHSGFAVIPATSITQSWSILLLLGLIAFIGGLGSMLIAAVSD